MVEIKEINPKENYQLEVILKNGNSITLDMKSRLHTLRFGVLSDKALFRRAETDGVVIKWDNKVEISASEVFELVWK